jgi:hypothetical protein
MQPDSVLVATDTTSPPTTVTVNSHSAFPGGTTPRRADPPLSSTQKDQLPACAGVALSKPSEASDSPGGQAAAQHGELVGRAGPQRPSPLNQCSRTFPRSRSGGVAVVRESSASAPERRSRRRSVRGRQARRKRICVYATQPPTREQAEEASPGSPIFRSARCASPPAPPSDLKVSSESPETLCRWGTQLGFRRRRAVSGSGRRHCARHRRTAAEHVVFGSGAR